MLEHGRQQAVSPTAAEVPGRRRHYATAARGETIPLCELRPTTEAEFSTPRPGGGGVDALKQLHAQSSAETSGVGDSLQRIHALSSTETSGYGADAVQSPTDLASITSPSDQPRVPATTSVCSALPQYQSAVAPMSVGGPRRTAGDYVHNGAASPTATISNHHHHHRRSSPTSGRRGVAVYRHGAQRFDDDEEFYVDDDNQSTSSRGRYSRPRARRSNGEGSGSDEGQFVGNNHTQSAWLRWSHERRASYRRKIEYMEKRQSDMERFRVSSPVRKARQESARLSQLTVNPLDLFWFYIICYSKNSYFIVVVLLLIFHEI